MNEICWKEVERAVMEFYDDCPSRDGYEAERNLALDGIKEIRVALELARAKRDEAVTERDDAREKQQQAHDIALKHKDRSVAAVKRADEAEEERDQVIVERDEVKEAMRMFIDCVEWPKTGLEKAIEDAKAAVK